MPTSLPLSTTACHLDFAELQIINEIEGLSEILRLVLMRTGLKFAAIGKFSDEHWIAYIINDEMHLGIKPGHAIPQEVALCTQVLRDQAELVIPHASQDPYYKHHPNIVKFGLDCYISFPVYLTNGELFGSLCATAPHSAAILNDPELIESLRLFARLSGRLLSTPPCHIHH
ncbi:GAF domain-containing protein [uncultured Pseudomonas sp.]|uniref:GAF domain-containing protein n=1 Tax=uncultured Pseudomonas sp. TaxID=114707 RepID=UPI0025E265C3|nr:GAF domain-containing protein [uncultured Pseudomonas sp.]